MAATGFWDKYAVPILTSVIGGVALIYVASWMGVGGQVEPTQQKKQPALDAGLQIEDVVGEWEHQLPVPAKPRLIFTKGGKLFWKRDARIDRVEFAIKNGKIELVGVTDNGKAIVYNASRKNNLMTLDVQGFAIAPSALSRLGGDWKLVGEYHPGYDNAPQPLDTRLPGKWSKGDVVLEILKTGEFHYRKKADKPPEFSGAIEFTGKGGFNAVVGGREVFPMTIAFAQANQFELKSATASDGEDKFLRGTWVRAKP